jgi:transglutaminase-like putative cysteine protease
MARQNVRHVTTYEYPRPVRFGEHRLLVRPRDSHDIRLVKSTLSIEPRATLRWLHDVFGNSIAIATFEEEGRLLRIESDITVDHFGVNDITFSLEDYAKTLPFEYTPDELPDLRPTMVPHQHDADGKLAAWTAGFLKPGAQSETMEVVDRMVRAVRDEFGYVVREEPGVQTPSETLKLGQGSCRDFAQLMVEACRSIGLAARFVTGYLYDPALDGGAADGTAGAGATHAWCQIYLPGMGWTEFDPTNASYAGTNLIRIGVARQPEQALPIQGSYYGDAGGEVSMSVDVRVTQIPS